MKLYKDIENISSCFGISKRRIVKTIQAEFEINQAIDFLKDRHTKNILEIGVCSGGSTVMWLDAFGADGIKVGIDNNEQWSHLGKERLKQLISQRIFLLRCYCPYFHMINKNSCDIKTLNEVENILKSDKIDFLFIDGSHKYEDVKKDYKMYSSLVRKGGVIGFHDISSSIIGTEVSILWNELEGEKIEYIHEIGAMGIGLLIKS